MDVATASLASRLGGMTASVPQAAASIAFRRGDRTWADVLAGPDTSPERAVGPESRFLIQSLSKSFVAVVILRLVASGKLSLDAPLTRWLPRVPNASRVTVRQCLQHTSGLPDYGLLTDYHDAVRQGAEPWTFEEFLDRTQAERLRFEPGTGWGYSNIGYMVLRRLIEDVTERSLADVIRTDICRPLGLSHTAVIGDRQDLRALTAGYSMLFAADTGASDVREVYHPGWIATGVLASTASDVLRFYHELFAGALLPDGLLAEMCATVRAAPSHARFVAPSYGLGLMADPDSAYGPMYGHNGSGPGYSASAYHIRCLSGTPCTVAVLLSTDLPEAAEILMFSTVQLLTHAS